MLKSTVARIVDICTRHAWVVILLAGLLTAGSVLYAVEHFAISTDINKLISPDLPWRQREIALAAAFPQRDDLIVIVIQAPTAELASQASDKLVRALSPRTDVFKSVRTPPAVEFFAQNGLLFLPVAEVAEATGKIGAAGPLIEPLAADPSLRGITEALQFATIAARSGRFDLNQLTIPFTRLADALDDVLAHRPTTFSWRALFTGKTPETRDLRRFIEVSPILDFGELEAGSAATGAIRKTVADLNLVADFHASIRLTGPVPMADEEFATVREGALVNGIGTIVAVLIILWFALRSGRIIFAVFVNLAVGLATTAALGLFMVGALNMISVAFAVLFIGLGVDFGIQFSVRYRAERFATGDLDAALRAGGAQVGGPLALAGAATAAGFLSFLPTDYRGLSELGQIAGCGMLIAFATSITLLPALLKVLNPPGEPHSLGYAWLAPVDRFLERHRVAVIVGTGLVALLGAPLLFFLRFDFNPINLRSPTVESVSTYLDLRKDPDTGSNSIEILAPSLAAADAMVPRLTALPQVARVMTLNTFVPDGQAEKLALIRKAAADLDKDLNPKTPTPPPTDDETVEQIKTTAEALAAAAAKSPGMGATAAIRLAQTLARLSGADAGVREAATSVLVPPLRTSLDELRTSLQAQEITLQTLPPGLVRDWMTPDGRARLEVAPKGDSNDNETLRAFATAVIAVEPTASGAPVEIQESGRTVVRAFIEAGAWALISIAILLWITLRRFGDVLLTLVPLILAGVVTLELCVLIGLPLNFANIIALPLLLGVGVAFKIYYIMAWRSGQTALLQSSLTRAIIFSAMTTATAFGSLWLSNHPGTSSMGKLLALSLACTLAAAVLFQPALMGRPRDKKPETS